MASRNNPLMKRKYENLLKHGKEKKVAITACMRKFLVILNAKMQVTSAGYPLLSSRKMGWYWLSKGTKKEETPIAARLFTIVDVWDALISDHPYRPAWTNEDTFAYLKEQSEKHFDPAVVELFFKTVKRSTELDG